MSIPAIILSIAAWFSAWNAASCDVSAAAAASIASPPASTAGTIAIRWNRMLPPLLVAVCPGVLHRAAWSWQHPDDRGHAHTVRIPLTSPPAPLDIQRKRYHKRPFLLHQIPR